MQKAFDSIKERLKKEKEGYEAEHAWNYAKGLEYAIEIVNQVAEEYKSNDSWIPCSERLPEEKENPITRDYYVYPVMVDLGKRSDIRYYGYGDGHWWHGLTKMDGLFTLPSADKA